MTWFGKNKSLIFSPFLAPFEWTEREEKRQEMLSTDTQCSNFFLWHILQCCPLPLSILILWLWKHFCPWRLALESLVPSSGIRFIKDRGGLGGWGEGRGCSGRSRRLRGRRAYFVEGCTESDLVIRGSRTGRVTWLSFSQKGLTGLKGTLICWG